MSGNSGTDFPGKPSALEEYSRDDSRLITGRWFGLQAFTRHKQNGCYTGSRQISQLHLDLIQIHHKLRSSLRTLCTKFNTVHSGKTNTYVSFDPQIYHRHLQILNAAVSCTTLFGENVAKIWNLQMSCNKDCRFPLY